MADKDVLWVEVKGDRVHFRGGKMPKEPADSMWSVFGDFGMSRTEFQRWSGIKFTGNGIYGLKVKLAVIDRMRVVTEKKMVAAEHTTRRLVRVEGK